MKGCNRKGKQQCYNKKKKIFFLKGGKKKSANKLSLLMGHLFLELGIHWIVVDLRKPIYSVFTRTMQIQPKCPVSMESCTCLFSTLWRIPEKRISLHLQRNSKPLSPEYHYDIWWKKLVSVSLITIVKSVWKYMDAWCFSPMMKHC